MSSPDQNEIKKSWSQDPAVIPSNGFFDSSKGPNPEMDKFQAILIDESQEKTQPIQVNPSLEETQPIRVTSQKYETSQESSPLPPEELQKAIQKEQDRFRKNNETETDNNPKKKEVDKVKERNAGGIGKYSKPTGEYLKFLKPQEFLARIGKLEEDRRLLWNEMTQLREQRDRRNNEQMKIIQSLSDTIKKQNDIIERQSRLLDKQNDSLSKMMTTLEILNDRVSNLEGNKEIENSKEIETPEIAQETLKNAKQESDERTVPIIEDFRDKEAQEAANAWQYEFSAQEENNEDSSGSQINKYGEIVREPKSQDAETPVTNEPEKIETESKPETYSEKQKEIISVIAKITSLQTGIEISVADSVINVTFNQEPKQEVPQRISQLTNLTVRMIFGENQTVPPQNSPEQSSNNLNMY